MEIVLERPAVSGGAEAGEPPARRAAGRYRVTDSLAGVPFAGATFWLPFNFASFARLRAF